MKFTKPGETETAESGDSNAKAGGDMEMPMIESPLTDRLDMDPMPLDETVESNAGMLDQLLSQDRGERIKALEDRVDELEAEKNDLQEQVEYLSNLLIQADSLSQITADDE